MIYRLFTLLLCLVTCPLNAYTLYHAEADWITVKLPKTETTAKIFYIAYKQPSDKTRPITFCFNGGPGAAAAWMHIAAFGPRRLDIPLIDPPHVPTVQMDNNPFSLLPTTDLVFVDPVTTGFSRANAPGDAKKFFNYENDVDSLSDFIFNYLKKNHSLERPVYLLGSSYATIRIVGMADTLNQHYNIPVAGLIMISTYLNYQTLLDNTGNDQPYPLFLPTYAAAAWHYNINNARSKELLPWIQEAAQWASTDYLNALMQGDSLSPSKREEVLDKLSLYTGLSKKSLEKVQLRPTLGFYLKDLLREEKRTIGRFDLRYQGIDSDHNRETWFDYDPSYITFGAVASGLHSYLANELNFKEPLDLNYYFLGKAGPWHYEQEGSGYFSTNKKLREYLDNNQNARVFVASGLFDLATPYYGTTYDLNHLGLSKAEKEKRIVHHLYEGGHMLYTDKTVLKELSKDLMRFMQNRIPTP